MKKLLLILLCLSLLYACDLENNKMEMEGFWANYDTSEKRIVSISYIAEDIYCAKISILGYKHYSEIPGVEDCKCRHEPEASWSIINGRLLISSPNHPEKVDYEFIKISDDEFSIKTERGILKCSRISKYQAISHFSK